MTISPIPRLQPCRKLLKFFAFKVSGRAIYLALIISFVALLYAFSFIISRYYQRVSWQNMASFTTLNDDLSSAFSVAMQSNSRIPFGKSTTLDIFPDTKSDIVIQKKFWGLYGLTAIKAQNSHHSLSKALLYGTVPESHTGLYLADHGHYLAIAGDSYLSGNCYLPRLGARKAYIDGQSFRYNKIVDGEIRESKPDLPALSVDLLSYFKDYLYTASSKDSITDDKALYSNKLFHSFRKSTWRIHAEDEILLDHSDVSGNIIVHSEKKITIAASTNADQILCVSPVIEVQEGFEGSIQLFALDTLIIGEGSRLLYPSAAVAYGKERSHCLLTLGENVVVEGSVLAFAEIMEGNSVEVKLNSGSEVYGEVYSAGKCMHRGKVFGSLYTDKFVLKTDQGYYENHLLSAWVDPEALEPSFALGLTHKTTHNKNNHIIQWLYD